MILPSTKFRRADFSCIDFSIKLEFFLTDSLEYCKFNILIQRIAITVTEITRNGYSASLREITIRIFVSSLWLRDISTIQLIKTSIKKSNTSKRFINYNRTRRAEKPWAAWCVIFETRYRRRNSKRSNACMTLKSWTVGTLNVQLHDRPETAHALTPG